MSKLEGLVVEVTRKPEPVVVHLELPYPLAKELRYHLETCDQPTNGAVAGLLANLARQLGNHT